MDDTPTPFRLPNVNREAVAIGLLVIAATLVYVLAKDNAKLRTVITASHPHTPCGCQDEAVATTLQDVFSKGVTTTNARNGNGLRPDTTSDSEPTPSGPPAT